MDLPLLRSNHALMMTWYPGQACRVMIYPVAIHILKLFITYHNLYNQLSPAKNNSNDVPDEDTTNMTESSAMAAGNLVAHPKLQKLP